MSSSAAMYGTTEESRPATFPISNGWQARRDIGKLLKALEWKQAFLKNLDGKHLLLHCQYGLQLISSKLPSNEKSNQFQFQQPAEKPSMTSLYHVMAVDPNPSDQLTLTAHCHLLASDSSCKKQMITLSIKPNNGVDYYSFVDEEEMMLYISLKHKTPHLEKFLKGS